MGRETLLLSSVGTTEYHTTTYTLDGVGKTETNLSPLALAELLDVDAALIARTDEAGAMYDDELGAGFTERGIEYEVTTIPKIEDRDDVDAVLDTLDYAIRDYDDVGVVLDVTHAFRSLPIVFFAALAYLDALDVVTIDGVYYGEYQGDQSQLIDLTYLYTLLEWFHAIRTFEQTGSLQSVQSLLQTKRRRLFQQGEHPHAFAKLVRKVEGTSRYLDSGLPMEAGLAASDALDVLDDVPEDDFVGPEGYFLDPLGTELSGLDVQQESTQKTDVELDYPELLRQRDLVEFYRTKEKYWFALQCGRELFVNRALYYASQEGITDWFDDETDPDAWFDRDTRKAVEDVLNEKAHVEEDNSPVITCWQQIQHYRNLYAHAGFNDDPIPVEQKVDDAIAKLCQRIDTNSFWEDLDG